MQLSYLVLTWIPTRRLDRHPSKHSAKTSKEETSLKDAPASSRQSTVSGRTPAKTAVKPLVPRAPWPKGVPAPSGRKGKSISPSTTTEKVVSAPPTRKEVEVQAHPPRLQTLRCSESCDTILVDPWGANVPTVSTTHLTEEYALGSDKEPLSVHLVCDPVSFNQENSVEKKVFVLTVSVDHRDSIT